MLALEKTLVQSGEQEFDCKMKENYPNKMKD